MSKKVVCVCGHFDPVHYGHIDYLTRAKQLANNESDGNEGTLIVIVNNDRQGKAKKGNVFMPAAERVKLIRSIRVVDACFETPDEDHTCREGIKMVYPDIFAIGLDEGPEYMKEEKELCKQMGVTVVCPLGARIQASSWLIENSKKNAEKRKAELAAKEKA